MTTAECADRLRYYGRKCEQHLSRGRLSHLLALRGIRGQTPASDSEVQELVRASFDEIGPDLLDTKLRRELHELHLVPLKANFELYLNRILTVVWTAHFGTLAPNAPHSRKLSLRDVGAAALQGTRARDLVIDTVVPTHGLKALVDAVTDATRIRVPRDLAGCDAAEWSQIRVAFEVRHLVEHRDGNVDGDFRRRVEGFWEKSTWGTRDPLVSSVRKISVEEEDVLCTYRAMCNATRLLTDALVQWNSLPDHKRRAHARLSRVEESA